MRRLLAALGLLAPLVGAQAQDIGFSPAIQVVSLAPAVDLQLASNGTSGLCFVSGNATLCTSELTNADSSGGYCTDSSGLLHLIAANTLRICGGTGLLVEESRQNLNIQSGNLANAAYTPVLVTATLNATTAPDGSVSAASLITTATAGFHQTNGTSFTVAASSNYTAEVFFKQDGWSFGYITSVPTGGIYSASFNISTCSQSGFFTGNTSNPTTGTQQYTNGWCRAWIVFPTGVAVSDQIQVGMLNASGNYTTGGSGDGTSGIFAWGAQVELGSFPTSYFPTTTVAATRSADNVQATGALLAAYKSTGVTQATKTSALPSAANVQRLGASFNTSAALNPGQASGATIAAIFNGTTERDATPGSSASYLLNTITTVGSFDATGDSIVANGGSETTSADTFPAVTTANIGSTGISSYLDGYIQRLAVFSSRLSAAQRVALSRTGAF